MKKILFVAMFIFGLAAMIFAQKTNLEDVISPEYAEYLKTNGNFTIIHPKNEKKLSAVPNCPYSEQIKSDLICENEKGVPFLAEFVYLIPKTELTEDISKVNVESMSVIFRSISKMQGMTYIHNGGKEEVLYKKAYAIASADSDEPIADPLEGPTDGLEAYGYQHDNTFGDTKYKLNYYQKDNVIFATFLNVIPMSKLGIKAVMPGCLRMNIVSIDLGDSLLLYLVADVSAKNLLGVRAQIQDSMTVRMDAIYRWFLKQYK